MLYSLNDFKNQIVKIIGNLLFSENKVYQCFFNGLNGEPLYTELSKNDIKTILSEDDKDVFSYDLILDKELILELTTILLE